MASCPILLDLMTSTDPVRLKRTFKSYLGSDEIIPLSDEILRSKYFTTRFPLGSALI
jgi:hypothetical protein